MKAISPMVAIILLIAFTVAIGGILSVWFPGLIRILTGPAEAAGEKVARCAAVWVRVEEVREKLETLITGETHNLTSIPKVITVNNIPVVSNSETIIWKNTTSGETATLTRDVNYTVLSYPEGRFNITDVKQAGDDIRVIIDYKYLKRRIIASNPSTLNITAIKLTTNGLECNNFTAATETDLEILLPGETDTYDDINTYCAVNKLNLTDQKTVVVRGLCLGEVPREGRCNKGDICWKT